MAAMVMFAGAIAAMYAALICMHVAATHGRGPAGGPSRSGLARWLAAAADRRRARVEAEAAHDLVAGYLSRERYHATMAATAAREDAEHPLTVPRV
ncbi:hypothetical protein ABZS66_51710 [Dactylosporangium sp. NPDC005572]|uniref:hypothetical protein n=1 Tax=Dactylosporangium sp. NPDC005572 TaxID=3156889 RepID=UPI0033BE53EA